MMRFTFYNNILVGFDFSGVQEHFWSSAGGCLQEQSVIGVETILESTHLAVVPQKH